MKYITKEKHYDTLFKNEKKNGLNDMGLMYSYAWDKDPKRLVFTLSRYKFVAKMFNDKNNVLEVGAADGWPSRIVAQSVKKLTISDFDPVFINYAETKLNNKFKINFLIHDMIKRPTIYKYDGIYALDVLEHINRKNESKFLKNISKSLSFNGALIIGVPSLESQRYSLESSKKGHVNCKTAKELKVLLFRHFSNVFLFSMNDEVLHTGFEKMSHYHFCLCTGVKNK